MPHERLKSACIDSAGRHPSIESLILKSLYDENGENGAHIKPAQDQKRDQDKSRQSKYHRNNPAEAKIEVQTAKPTNAAAMSKSMRWSLRNCFTALSSSHACACLEVASRFLKLGGTLQRVCRGRIISHPSYGNAPAWQRRGWGM
jgi:hypothetical protein